MSRLIFELQTHAQLVRRQRVRIQRGAELVQESRENKRERLEFGESVFEFERVCKNRRWLFGPQMSLSFTGRELLKFYSGLAQTFGNAGNGKCGEICEGTNAPETQCF